MTIKRKNRRYIVDVHSTPLSVPVTDEVLEDFAIGAEEERRILTPYAQIVPKPEGNAQIGDVIVADGATKDGDRVLGNFKELTVRVEKRLAFKDGLYVGGVKAGLMTLTGGRFPGGRIAMAEDARTPRTLLDLVTRLARNAA